jgi:hypothetical protein
MLLRATSLQVVSYTGAGAITDAIDLANSIGRGEELQGERRETSYS